MLAGEEDVEQESSPYSENGSEDLGWIQWYTGLKGNDFFCEVDEEFIQDDFNIFGVAQQVDFYEAALETILDAPPQDDITPEEEEAIESSAEFMYGLIHARYIITAHGLQAMEQKFKNAEFGRCPRVFCNGQHLLPIALTDVPRQNTVKLYCPKCMDVYAPRSTRHQVLDGAYFGTSFPFIFLMQFPEHVPMKASEVFEPRVFGYKVHKSSPVFSISADHMPDMEDGDEEHDDVDDDGDGDDDDAGGRRKRTAVTPMMAQGRSEGPIPLRTAGPFLSSVPPTVAGGRVPNAPPLGQFSQHALQQQGRRS
eukprot:ANDGO_00777.mRNA.1 Putative casein kinase II subunit beta-4